MATILPALSALSTLSENRLSAFRIKLQIKAFIQRLNRANEGKMTPLLQDMSELADVIDVYAFEITADDGQKSAGKSALLVLVNDIRTASLERIVKDEEDLIKKVTPAFVATLEDPVASPIIYYVMSSISVTLSDLTKQISDDVRI